MEVRIRREEKALVLPLSGKLDAIIAPDGEQPAAALATAR